MKTLILTDLQNDFLPGGALGVPSADLMIPLINQLLPHFEHVIATMDWHPAHHVSFASTHGKKPRDLVEIHGKEQILWPDHCIQNSWGAALVKELDENRIERFFYKGSDPAIDSYSVFFDALRHRSTGLADYLHKNGLKDLYFCGLTTDYCVLYSVLDARELGFSVTVIRDCCYAINLKKGDEEDAFKKMQAKGARIVKAKDLMDEIAVQSNRKE